MSQLLRRDMAILMVMTTGKMLLVKLTGTRNMHSLIQPYLICLLPAYLCVLSAPLIHCKAMLMLVNMYMARKMMVHNSQLRLTSSISTMLCTRPFQQVLEITLTSCLVQSSFRALSRLCIGNVMALSSMTAHMSNSKSHIGIRNITNSIITRSIPNSVVTRNIPNSLITRIIPNSLLTMLSLIIIRKMWSTTCSIIQFRDLSTLSCQLLSIVIRRMLRTICKQEPSQRFRLTLTVPRPMPLPLKRLIKLDICHLMKRKCLCTGHIADIRPEALKIFMRSSRLMVCQLIRIILRCLMTSLRRKWVFQRPLSREART